MHVQLSTGLKHQRTQNSRQLWGGWVGPTLYAISIQKKLLTIMDGPLIITKSKVISYIWCKANHYQSKRRNPIYQLQKPETKTSLFTLYHVYMMRYIANIGLLAVWDGWMNYIVNFCSTYSCSYQDLLNENRILYLITITWDHDDRNSFNKIMKETLEWP